MTASSYFNYGRGRGSGSGGTTVIVEPGGPPTVAKYNIDTGQVFSTTENAWRSLTLNGTATQEQNNDGGDISANATSITIGQGTWNIRVIVTVDEEDDNRRAFAIRLVDEDGNVLEDYPSTTYMRGVGGDFNDRTRLEASFDSVIVSDDTTFSIQSAAVEVEDSTPQTVNVWSTAPGGIVIVTKVAVGAKGDPGSPGRDATGGTVDSDNTLTGTGESSSPLGVANNAISTDKLQDGAVTAGKIAGGVIPTVPDAPGQATEDAAGIAAIATSAEAAAGTNNTKIMTPSKTKGLLDALPDGAPSYARNKGETVSINTDETAAVAAGTNIDRTFDELIDAITIIGNATTDTTLTLNVADNADLTQYAGRRMTFKNDGRGGTSSIVINNTSSANMEFFHGSRDRTGSITSNTISLGYRQVAQLIFTNDFRIHVLYNQSGIDIDDLKSRPYFRGPWAAGDFKIGDISSHAGEGYLLLGGNKTESDTTNPADDSDWVQITGTPGGGTSTPVTSSTGFGDHLKAAGREYDATLRTSAELAVWNTFSNQETISGTLIVGSEIETARTRRRLLISSSSNVSIPSGFDLSALDALADNNFPIRILVRRTHAGNLTIVRTARLTQDALSSGNAVFAFTANQVKELIITRTTFTTQAGDPIYAANMIDGISADTMAEKGTDPSAGFKALAYLFDRYFHLYRGPWSSGGYYKTADIVSNRARLFIAFADNGPSALEPYRSTNWHPLDANVSYRGPFLAGSARYKTGDITLENGVLFILITGSLTNSNTLPSADPTNWVPLNQQAASQAEVNAGLNTSKFVNPATLKAHLASIALAGGFTSVDMGGQTYLRLAVDGQTITSSSTTQQINKTQADHRDISLIGDASNESDAIRLVISTQGQDAAFWEGVVFIISNGTDTDIDNFGIAGGAGNGTTISSGDIIPIPSKRRALVWISASSAPTVSANGLTLNVRLIDGAPGTGGTVVFANEAQAKALADTTRSINPQRLGQVVAAHARAEGVAGRTKMAINRIMDAIEHADNAGDIDPITGFDLMGLFFTTRTDIGHGNEQWVFGRCDNVLELRSIQVGADDNPDRTHNYILVLKDNAVRHNHILDPLDIDNLIGIAFPQYPASPSAGDELVHRMTFGWAANSDAPFTRNPNAVDITIPRKKTADTRTITGILVRAGRVSGLTETSTLAEIFDATTADSAVFHEVVIPIWGSRHQAVAGSATIQTVYRVFFADGVHISMRVNEALADNGQVVIEADVNHATNVVLDGTEAISFHAIRSIGG